MNHSKYQLFAIYRYYIQNTVDDTMWAEVQESLTLAMVVVLSIAMYFLLERCKWIYCTLKHNKLYAYVHFLW
jgi:hypothetical protein